MADNVDGIDELNQVIDGLDDFVDGRGPNTMKATIPKTTKRVFKREILPEVKRRGRDHVGSYVETIDEKSLGGRGDRYSHGIGSDNVVVQSHEYGTGRYNTNTNGSFSKQAGYRIPAESSNGPITINSAGREQVVEYVVHPGVKPKKFMERTVTDMADRVADEVGDDLVDALDDQLDI